MARDLNLTVKEARPLLLSAADCHARGPIRLIIQCAGWARRTFLRRRCCSRGGAALSSPVCAAPAEYLTLGSYDGVVERCRRCGDYQVIVTVFDKLLRLSIEQRSAALEAAEQRASSHEGARDALKMLGTYN